MKKRQRHQHIHVSHFDVALSPITLAVEAVQNRVKSRRRLKLIFGFPQTPEGASKTVTNRLGKALAGSAMPSGVLPEGLCRFARSYFPHEA